jgi:3-oxoacyl-[acyl-carrier-protein] synthase II
MLTPLGVNIKESWDGVISGKSGIALLTEDFVADLPTRFAGKIPAHLNVEAYLSGKDIRKMDPFIQYALIATDEAIKDSGLDIEKIDSNRAGVSIGSGIGGIKYIEETSKILAERGARRVSPMFIPSIIINMSSGHVSMKYGFKGPNLAYATACTTGTHSIGEAARTIKYGDADIMIAGGSEKSITLLGLSGFCAARALSTRNDDPAAASRPWDRDRDGFVMGDGAGILVLEELEHAKKRGAKIYAELAGYGTSACAYHMTLPSPDGSGARRAMENALNDAKVNVTEVDYINAHATSTRAGDETENLAIKTLFQDHAYKLMVSSTKSMTGHLLGAAGAVEAIFCLLAMRDSIIPPTINLENPDEGCDLDYVPNTARQHKVDVVVNNSFGFGGTNGAIVFKAYKE